MKKSFKEVFEMSTFVANRGKLGTTEFYNAVMKADVLINSVKPASVAFPDWEDMSIEERMQRDLDRKRIITQIAPYFQKDPERFFSALVIDVYQGWEKIEFEPLSNFAKDGIPAAYRTHSENVGFLTLPGGQFLIALDGQHRLEAIRYAIEGYRDPRTGEEILPSNPELANEDISVIFIKHDDDRKVRKIFGKLNRYAKRVSTSDNYIISEDDPFAIITRRLVLQSRGGIFPEDAIDWKHTTISKNSNYFTTISALYDITKLFFEYMGHDEGKMRDELLVKPTHKFDPQFNQLKEFWELILGHVDQIREAFKDKNFREWREDQRSLIFKPAGLVAMVEGILKAAKAFNQDKVGLEKATKLTNKIDWDTNNEAWRDIIIKPDGNIDARQESRRVAAELIAYTIAKEKIGNNVLTKDKETGKTKTFFQKLKEDVAHRKGLENDPTFDTRNWDLPLPEKRKTAEEVA